MVQEYIGNDILAITGILVNAKSKFGDLNEITYSKIDGNEEKISYIIKSLEIFLHGKEYLRDDSLVIRNTDYFQELSLLLLVNMEYSKPFNIEEFIHLSYNVPKISRYLLTRIIVHLDLTQYFCLALEKLPLEYSCEVFSDFIPCLDKFPLPRVISDISYILKTIVVIIAENSDKKHTDEMDELIAPTSEFFIRISRVSTEQLPKLKKNTLYEQAGYALKKLLFLLEFCNQHNMTHGLFIERLIEAVCSIARGVSLDMFIHWAEVEFECGRTLQSEITEAAYSTIEKYQHLKLATDMVQVLKPFASKPKDIKEQINSADSEKLIYMVNKADKNQTQWFEALVFSPFHSNEKAVECIEKWCNLCNADDVSRLLNQSCKIDNSQVRRTTFKCASSLILTDLIVVVTRHFYNNGFVTLEEDVQSQIVLLFNRMECKNLEENSITKELLLLILKNPEESVNYTLTECLRSGFYIDILKKSFNDLKDVLMINNFLVDCFHKVRNKFSTTDDNYKNYVFLLKVLSDVGVFSTDILMMDIFNISIRNSIENGNLNELVLSLKIFRALNLKIEIDENRMPFLINLMKILAFRTEFINHRPQYQEAVGECVELLSEINRNSKNDVQLPNMNPRDDKFFSFYEKCWQSAENLSFLKHFFPDFNVNNKSRVVGQLLQILPACVTKEWLVISSEILKESCPKNLLDILKDLMILLCQFTQNQENSENYSILSDALTYCIHQMGQIIQALILMPPSMLEKEVLVAEMLVDLLSYIPSVIRETEGIKLLSFITERSLKVLGKNKEFVTRICKIKNTKICQVLAQKILQ